ncbi:MAG: hypothetical protein IJ890_05485 [Clostridia bacterium]|nr:hypothetical protein [Clostridia bacterium]
MTKITLDVKKLQLLKMGCSKEEQKYILKGISIKDYKHNNDNCYRDYVSTDGKILLLIREKIKEIELLRNIVIFFDKIVLPTNVKNFEELKLDFEITNNKLINTVYNIILDYDKESIYPNYAKIIPDSVKETDKQIVIDYNYLKIIDKFFNNIRYKHFKFYTDKNNRGINVQIERKNDITKLMLVMGIDTINLLDINTTNKILKEFNNI